MKKLINIIQKHTNTIKYLGAFIVLVSMIISIRTYQNYTAIIDAIETVNADIKNKTEEINFTQNFLNKYLDSEYADFFLAHENNVLFKNELILRLDLESINQSGDLKEIEEKNNNLLNPRNSRKDFFLKKIKEIK